MPNNRKRLAALEAAATAAAYAFLECGGSPQIMRDALDDRDKYLRKAAPALLRLWEAAEKHDPSLLVCMCFRGKRCSACEIRAALAELDALEVPDGKA